MRMTEKCRNNNKHNINNSDNPLTSRRTDGDKKGRFLVRSADCLLAQRIHEPWHSPLKTVTSSMATTPLAVSARIPRKAKRFPSSGAGRNDTWKRSWSDSRGENPIKYL